MAIDLSARALGTAYADMDFPAAEVAIERQTVVQALINPRFQHDYRSKSQSLPRA
jgi:hypothetical protein